MFHGPNEGGVYSIEAIILAGGFGTRLQPLTYTRAKSLLPILNKPMITYLIDMLPQEVDKVILAVNYQKDQIESYFNTNKYDKKIIVNDEPEPLGTGGAVKFAEDHITGPFFVLNADTICSLNLQKMIAFHKEKQAVATISLWPVEHVSEFGVVEIQKNGNISNFVEKPKPEDAPSNLINAGAYLLEPEVLDYIEKGRLISMEKEIFPQIINDTGKFFGYIFQGFWVDVGRISSYLHVNDLLLKQRHLSSLQGKQSIIDGKLSATCVGDSVTIQKNSTIHSSVIFDHVYIKENVQLQNCVVGEGCLINKQCILQDVVIGDKEVIAKQTTKNNALIWTKPIPAGYPKKQIGNVIGE